MLENGQMMTLNIRDILPNRFQPRIHFEESKLSELAESITKYGLIQPIVVRQIGSKYEIISGERRFKASFLANKETIPAIVVNLTDRECEEIALLENIQRQDLTPIEEAVSFKRILDVGYITQEQLAAKVGKSQSFIANKIRLLNLDDDVQDALLHGKISERHARSLLKLHNKNRQVEMLNKIIDERLTVKMTDKAIKEVLESGEEEVPKKIEPKKISKKKEEKVETLVVEKKKKPAVPAGSHQIIKVSPPKDLEEILKSKERGASFMDIDKILEEAKDITPEEEAKQPNDIADLMKQNPDNVTSPLIQSEPQEEVNNQMPNGLPMPASQNRFVSVNQEMPQTEETPSPEISIPASPVNFDSVFGQVPNQDFNNNLQFNGQNNMQVGMMPNMMNGGDASFNNPMMQPQPNQIPLNPAMPVNNGFNPMNLNNGQDASFGPGMNQSIDANVPMNSNFGQNNMNNSFGPNLNQVPMGGAMPPLMPNDNPGALDNFGAGVNPDLGGLPNNLPPVNMPDQNMVPEDLNGISNPQAGITNPGMPILNIPDSDILESSNDVSPIDNAMPLSSVDGEKDFKQVLDLIRNCSSEIEKLGYFIDVDEMDQGDSYQVTFKINKE